MLESEEMNADDRELVDALKNLQPAGAAISLREIAFQAGLETARRQANRWRMAALAMTAVAVLAVGWLRRPAQIVERVVYLRTEPAASVMASVTPTAVVAPEPSARVQYLNLCDEVMYGEVGREKPANAPQAAEFDMPGRASREDPARVESLISDGFHDEGDGR